MNTVFNRKFRLPLALFCAAPLISGWVYGQDSRNVQEPAIPAVCQVLKASLTATDGALTAADEAKLDTRRIQDAFDHCAKGEAVELSADGTKNAFLSGPLTMDHAVTLLVDGGVTLFASRNPRDFDDRSGGCGAVDEKGGGCKALITVTSPNAAIMGDGVIDGRGQDKLIGQDQTWWDLAELARSGGRQNCFRLIVADHADNFILYRITLRNSPNFHVMVSKTDGFTAWGVKIDTPPHARNTDGIDPSGSTNVTIAHSWIRDGDDNVAIKAGGAGPATNISIVHDHFYYGHGMSIGSETFAGANHILVSDLTMDGTTSGIRIKSDVKRGGLVEDVTYQNVCMREIKRPIDISPFYERNAKQMGDLVPVYRNIDIRGVHDLTPGKVIMDGIDAAHAGSIWLNGVEIDGVRPEDVQAQYGAFTLGPGAVNFTPLGQGVTVRKGAGDAAAVPDCKGRFVPFPNV